MAGVSSKLLLADTQPQLSLVDPGLPNTGSDVLLRFPCGNTLRTHSLILRLASPLIAEKLRSAALVPEGEASCAMVLDLDAELALFQRLLKLLYPVTLQPQLAVHEAARLYPLCHKYGFSGVMEACRQVLEGPDLPGLLGKSNPIDSPSTWVTACQWLELARGYSLPVLEAQCAQYIHSWRTAKVSLGHDRQLLGTIDDLRRVTEAVMVGLGRCSTLPSDESISYVSSLAERLKRLVKKSASAGSPPALPGAGRGGA